MGERELTAWAEGRLERIATAGGLRACHTYAVSATDPALLTTGGQPLINFGSNDYLGLGQASTVRAAAVDEIGRSGVGVGASRVLTGTRGIHETLEATLSSWLQKERVLLFGAGYLANLGVLSSLVGRHDVVVADRFVHASMLDGIALSGAKLIRFTHNNVDDLRSRLKAAHAARLFVVTESVFSMDGDIAPLDDIVAVASEVGASVIVDEAHALGVFGAEGAGVLTPEVRREVAVITGTLSKACGSYGGFAACSKAIHELLISTARSFLFNTGLPPASAAASCEAIAIIRRSASERSQLQDKAAQLRVRLRDEGFMIGNSVSHIIPIVLGSSEAVLRAGELLLQAGFIVPAIRPPTVAPGSERLRISLTNSHSAAQIDALVATLCRYRDGGR